MTFRSVGINLPLLYPADGILELAGRLETLKAAGAGFVELWPQGLGVILGGGLDAVRLREVREVLVAVDLAYTVHAPLEVNLMDPTAPDLQREVLRASLRFAGEVGADVVVCHAGQRVASRDAFYSMQGRFAAEQRALREAGDEAAKLGITIAVENYYPELPILQGAVYDYSVWPGELAEQITSVDHEAVGICLDVGHAALAADAFGFDLFEECAAAAPLVRHVHLHDNLGRANLTGTPPVSEHPVFGLGDLHLPPGRGALPLEELFRRIDLPKEAAFCVELDPALFSLAPEALDAARGLAEFAAREWVAF